MNSAILGSYRTGNKMKDFKPLVFAVYIVDNSVNSRKHWDTSMLKPFC